MRILDTDNQGPVRRIHVYLTPEEAEKLTRALTRLVRDPEASEAQRVVADDGSRDLSVSIVTPAKLHDVRRYTDAERRMFAEP
jgi:hypothetical protein